MTSRRTLAATVAVEGLLERIDELEREREGWKAREIWLEGQVRALAQRVLESDDLKPGEHDAATVRLIHATLRSIVSNPESKRGDVQGQLLNLLGQTGGFDT